MDFSDGFKHTTATQTTKDRAHTIMLCWSIWRARNDLVWSNRRWSAIKIVAKAWEYLSQRISALSRHVGAPIQPQVKGDGAIFWVKPQLNAVKVTIDAAVVENEGKSGIGLVARNHEGRLLLAKTRSYAEVMNPTLVEAIAIKEALSWAKDMEWEMTIIESVCLVGI